MRIKFNYTLLLLFAVGCSYSVDTVKPEKIATSYTGTVLPATMNLYLSEELKSKIWEGHPSSSAASVHTFQVPLGSVVSSASKKTFQSLFRQLNIVDSIDAVKGARGTIVPTITDYSFGVPGMTLVSPGTLQSDIFMHFKILDNNGNTIWEKDVQGTGKEKGKMTSMINPLGSWRKDLPVTTERAIQDALKKISVSISDSQKIREYLQLEKTQLAENVGISGSPKEIEVSQQKPFLPKKDMFRQHWAVVIGVSRYSDSRIQSLRYATSDAEYFFNWLISSKGGKYAPNNIKLLLDEKATGRNIKDALFNWLRQAIEEDIVIIYFAGHGSPDSPDTPENLYLLPYDTQYDNIAATGFPMWDVETALKRFIKAKRVIVIADACHSGGVGQSFDVSRRSTRGIGVNPISTRLEKLSEIGKGVAVISASGDQQTSQEGNQWGGGHGVFTYYLMEALNGKADYNQDSKVSLGELIPFLSEQVRRATRSAQSPTVSGAFDPALAIAR